MEQVSNFVTSINGIVWGPLMLILILGTGFYLMAGLKFAPLRNIPKAFKLLIDGRKSDGGDGQISPFNALMTSLSATIGTGNIAGVATAISIGGPGALFWMWCTALVGMATKYGEAVLAVEYREVDEQGSYSGGPMYYIKNGLGENWRWLAWAFSFFAIFAGFGMGNTVQANSVADAMQSTFDIDPIISSAVMVILVGMVLLGGVKRIATVAGVLVFSNEAGLGSAPIAHAAAQTNDPVKQGTIAMLGTFIDTLIVCTITGLVIVITGVWTTGEGGASLTAAAFASQIPYGDVMISIGLCFFAFTTILGWSFYGERCVVYIFGTRAILPFRVLWIGAIPFGAAAQLGFIWLLADTFNALMAIPNLIALLLLSPVIFKLSKKSISDEVEAAKQAS